MFTKTNPSPVPTVCFTCILLIGFLSGFLGVVRAQYPFSITPASHSFRVVASLACAYCGWMCAASDFEKRQRANIFNRR